MGFLGGGPSTALGGASSVQAGKSGGDASANAGASSGADSSGKGKGGGSRTASAGSATGGHAGSGGKGGGVSDNSSIGNINVSS